MGDTNQVSLHVGDGAPLMNVVDTSHCRMHQCDMRNE